MLLQGRSQCFLMALREILPIGMIAHFFQRFLIVLRVKGMNIHFFERIVKDTAYALQVFVFKAMAETQFIAHFIFKTVRGDFLHMVVVYHP